MLPAIISVSLILFILFVMGVTALVGIIANFKKDNEKVRKNLIKIVLCIVFACVCGMIDGVLITKYLYDNREKVAEIAGNMAEKAVTAGFELTTKGAMAAADTYKQLYNEKVIKQFENLSINFLSKREEATADRPDLSIRDLKESKITAIELVFDNTISRTEE